MSSKMREALKQIEAYASSLGLWDIEAVAKTALAEPLKNYEVGTPEEQAERWLNFCDDVERKECPQTTCKKCPVYWVHMPYESEVKQ